MSPATRSDRAEAAIAPDADFEIEVFFDGACPLCQREIALLRRWDREHRIRLTDIAATDFRADALGISQTELMSQLHGRMPDGRWLEGVEVFRRMYAAVGWRRLAAVSRWPGLTQLLELGYRVFARNRLRWTGRCGEACDLPAQN